MINKKNLKRNIIILLLIILAIIPFKLLRLSHAEEEVYSLNAVLYDTDQYSGGTGTELTETGVTISNWEFNTSKYLQIIPNVPADGNTYKVQVILPQEMYIVGTELSTPAGFSNVNFVKNEAISVNGGTGTYNLNSKSGTATYTMNYMAERGTIQLELRYDITLWDEQKNSPITASDVFPVIVKLIKDTNGENEELKRKSISKITSKSALPGSVYFTYSTTLNTTDTTSPIEILTGTRATSNLNYSVNDAYSNESCFFSELNINIKLPKYKYNNTDYYLSIDESTIKLNSMKTSTYNYTIDKSTEGVVNIKVENAYFGHSGIIITFTFNDIPDELSEKDSSEFPMKFENGNITIYGNGKNGNNNIRLRTKDLPSITYLKDPEAKVSISKLDRLYTITNIPHDTETPFGGAVYGLGIGMITNSGTEDSGPKTFRYKFDTNNTGKIKVTTINVHADLVSPIIYVKYTLVDENGEIVYLDENDNRVSSSESGAIGEWVYLLNNSNYGKSTLDNLYNRLMRSMLPNKQQQYYFKTIEYTLGAIKAKARLYSTGGNRSFASAGNFFGYVAEDVEEDEDFISEFYMINTESEVVEQTNAIKLTTTTTNNPAYSITNAVLDKSSIIAGDSCTISGRVTSIEYPYGYSGWLNGIRIGVVLPTGISINKEAINIKTATGIKVSNVETISRNLNDGKVLWIIKIPEDIVIGYAKEDLTPLKNGEYLTFSLQLNTSYTMDATSIFANEMLLAAGYQQSNSASGSFSWAAKTDSYDLNEDGMVNDKIACVNKTNVSTCQIISRNAMLSIDDNIAITSNNITSSSSNSVTMVNDTDTVLYNLNIECASGGRAPILKYYIPIVKKDSIVDGFLIKDNSMTFDLGLMEAVSVEGKELYNIEYTFDKNLTYVTAQECTNWYTKEDIESDSELKLEDVTMVRITTKEGGINNGDFSKIILKLKYVGNSFYKEAGMKNTWCGGGYYEHITGEREVAGNYTTVGVLANIEAEFDSEEITLTAAKDMEPKTEGNVNSVDIDKNIFSEFINPQTFKLYKIETYNVTLQTKENILTNTEMPSSDANKTYAITVKLGNGEEKNIIDEQINETIGTSNAGQAPEFKFKLYNGNNLTDNSTSRYIIVTFKSNNGVIYTQKIIINREIGKASDPKIAIISGKNYITFSETTDLTTISQDSAFTAQFVTEYIPSVYKNHILEFSNNMPAGTTITLLNLSNENEPKYYYYKIETPTSLINFSDFIKMGSTSNIGYDYSTEELTIEEKLLVVVDFSNVNDNLLPTGTYNLKLKMESDIVETSNSKELNFVTTNKREYNLDGNDTTKFDEDYTISYTIGQQQGSESKYDGRKVSLVITLPNDIPEDTTLTIDETKYYQNNNKQFIVQIGDISEKEGDINMKISSKMLPKNAKSYDLNMSLWVSATANAEIPFEGEKIVEKIITINSEQEITASLKINEMSSRAIHKNELTNEQNLEFDCIIEDNCEVTIELTQKIGSGYQKVTDKLTKINEITTHNIGVFDINAQNGVNIINFKLSSETEVGTYRFIIRIKTEDGKEILTVPYNFMVVEDL